MNTLPHDRLIYLLYYDNGNLFWRISFPGVKVHSKAGFTNKRGYTKIKIDGKLFFKHRLIYFMFHQEWPKIVDHIDKVKSNDLIENLRPATNVLNSHNCDFTNGKQGIRGVHYDNRLGKFRAQIQVNGVKIHIGLFSTVDDAKYAYEKVKHEMVKGL